MEELAHSFGVRPDCRRREGGFDAISRLTSTSSKLRGRGIFGLTCEETTETGHTTLGKECWVVEDILAWLACAKTKQNSSK